MPNGGAPNKTGRSLPGAAPGALSLDHMPAPGGDEPGDDDITQPGAPRMLDGPPEARAVAELAAVLRFYAGRLDQLAGELRRGPMDIGQRAGLGRDLREVSNAFAQDAERVAPAPPRRR